MKKTVSKISKVLAYLKTGHSLDMPKAVGMWGHIRLSDMIFKLRKKGHDIRTELVKNGDVEFAIYRLQRVIDENTPAGTKVRVKSKAAPYKGREGVIKHIDISVAYPVEVSFGVEAEPYLFKELAPA